MGRKKILESPVCRLPVTTMEPTAGGEFTIVLFDGDHEVARASRTFRWGARPCGSDDPEQVVFGPFGKDMKVTSWRAYIGDVEIRNGTVLPHLLRCDTMTFNLDIIGLIFTQ